MALYFECRINKNALLMSEDFKTVLFSYPSQLGWFTLHLLGFSVSKILQVFHKSFLKLFLKQWRFQLSACCYFSTVFLKPLIIYKCQISKRSLGHP